MNTPPRRRFPRWAFVLGVLGFFLVAFLTLGFFVNRHADKRWAQAKRKAQNLLEDLPAFDGRRPPLWGDSEAGNAWDDYRPAMEKMQDLPEKELFASRTYRTEAAARKKIVAAVARLQPALQSLARGAHRSSASWAYEWEKGGNTSVPAWELIATLIDVQRASAWLLLDKGESRKCAEALLDAAQLARDSFAGASVTQADFALKWLHGLSEDLHEFLLSKKTLHADLDRLSRGLRTLDEQFPNLWLLLRNEGVNGAYSVLSGPEGNSPEYLPAHYRIQGAEAIDFIERVLAQSEGVDDQPWVEVAQKQSELEALVSRNEAMDGAYPTFRLKVVERWRTSRAQYALLRIAAQFLAGGDASTVGDPLGDKIQSRVTGRTLRVWSAGVDGVDDGGDDKKDLVIEVTRP